MGKARIRVSPAEQNSKVDRYLTKDVGVLAKKRLKKLKIFGISLFLSICLNIYLYHAVNN